MSVFSGVIPTINVGNNELNNLLRGTAVNLGTSTLSVGVSQVFGAAAAKSLGLAPVSGSNFLGSIVSPGLITTGVNGLSQAVGNSITNSKALGPFGPLAGNIATQVVGNLSRDLTNSIFGGLLGGLGNKESVYFPGAGGPGEEPAAGNAYSVGFGGPDVVISIRYAANAAQEDAAAANAESQPGGTGGLPQGQQAATNATEPLSKSSGVVTATSSAVAATTTAQAAGAATGAAGPPTGPEYASVGAAQQAAAQGTSTSQSPPASNTKPEPVKPAWKFICTPDDISWETTAQADRISIFGANQAPVIAGVKGMRELTMSNAIVEGFCRNKAIESKVILLEELMNMFLGPENRYIQVPVYRVSANSKIYGKGLTDGGFFIIKSIKVQEKLRDSKGKATRAIVDISFTQVPRYQVSTGRDIASKFLASQKGPFAGIESQVKATGFENAKLQERLAREAAAASQRTQGVGDSKPGSGSAAPAASPPAASGGNAPAARDPTGSTGIRPLF